MFMRHVLCVTVTELWVYQDQIELIAHWGGTRVRADLH